MKRGRGRAGAPRERRSDRLQGREEYELQSHRGPHLHRPSSARWRSPRAANCRSSPSRAGSGIEPLRQLRLPGKLNDDHSSTSHRRYKSPRADLSAAERAAIEAGLTLESDGVETIEVGSGIAVISAATAYYDVDIANPALLCRVSASPPCRHLLGAEAALVRYFEGMDQTALTKMTESFQSEDRAGLHSPCERSSPGRIRS